MRALELRFQQCIGIIEEPCFDQCVRGSVDHRLARVGIGRFAIGARDRVAHALLQRRGQRGVLRIEAGQRDFGRDRDQSIGGPQAGVGDESIERSGPRCCQTGTLGRFRRSHESRDLAGISGERVEVLAYEPGIGEHGKKPCGRRGIGRGLRVLRRCSGGKRFELETHRRVLLVCRTCLRQSFQRRRDAFLRNELLLVGDPRVVSEHPPIVGGKLCMRAACRKRRRQRVLDRTRAVHPHRQHLHVLLGIGLAGQAHDFPAVGSEQNHRRIAGDIEARAELLCARAVAVDVYGDKKARALDEILAIEERRLDLVTRRAPHRAPV